MAVSWTVYNSSDYVSMTKLTSKSCSAFLYKLLFKRQEFSGLVLFVRCFEKWPFVTRCFLQPEPLLMDADIRYQSDGLVSALN